MSNENYSETLLGAVTSVSNGTVKQVAPMPAPYRHLFLAHGRGAILFLILPQRLEVS